MNHDVQAQEQAPPLGQKTALVIGIAGSEVVGDG